MKPYMTDRWVMVSRRRYAALLAAEEFCRAFRTFTTMRVVDQTQRLQSEMFKRLDRWMNKAGKSKYDTPKGWPI